MNGYVNNQNNTLIGIAKDEDECGRMVNQQVPLASGATYAKHNKTCWAGTSESIHLSSGFRACLLNGLCNCSLPKYFWNRKYNSWYSLSPICYYISASKPLVYCNEQTLTTSCSLCPGRNMNPLHTWCSGECYLDQDEDECKYKGNSILSPIKLQWFVM